MPKVLKAKRKGDFTAYTVDGGGYDFFAGGANGGMQLFLTDAHANEILAKYKGEIDEVPEASWPEKYKNKVKEFTDIQIKEATTTFPIIKELLGKKTK